MAEIERPLGVWRRATNCRRSTALARPVAEFWPAAARRRERWPWLQSRCWPSRPDTRVEIVQPQMEESSPICCAEHVEHHGSFIHHNGAVGIRIRCQAAASAIGAASSNISEPTAKSVTARSIGVDAIGFFGVERAA